MENTRNALFITDELKKAFDDIYKYPLKDYAKEAISRQLRSGINDFQLVELVCSLRENNQLVLFNNDDNEQDTEPRILCSLGIKQV